MIIDGVSMTQINKTQRLQQWLDDTPEAESVLYGEFMHLGANQTILKVGLHGINLQSDSVVLDMACAVGGNGRWLASLFHCRVFGNDIDERVINVAKDLAEIEGIADRCEFFVASVADTGLESESCDLVLSTDVYNMAEVARVLKPGGRFLLSSLFRDGVESPQQMAEDLGFEVELRRDVTGLAQTFLRTKEEEARLLHKAGIIDNRQLIGVLNDILTPNRRGGHHLLVRWRKP